jgi:hypothetical protein
LSVLYADIALALCVAIAVGLRALIVGDRFDRALHRLDPTYRNSRDMTRGLFVDPISGLKDLPQAYSRYSGATFRPVDNPEVEQLRRRTVRAWVEAAVLGAGGLGAVGVVGALLRRISLGLDELVVLAVLAILGLYWLWRLLHELRRSEGSTMPIFYALGGIATALGALVFVLVYPSRLA